MLARDAMPNATSVGVLLRRRVFATAVTRSFHCGWPPCASSSTPVFAAGCCATPERQTRDEQAQDADWHSHQ